MNEISEEFHNLKADVKITSIKLDEIEKSLTDIKNVLQQLADVYMTHTDIQKDILKIFYDLHALQKDQTKTLETMMQQQCSHVQKIAGTLLGARILHHAGSLKRLAELPSSTIQLLGAEKALFRHLRTGAKPPRFGILFAHENIAKAPEKERGKTARRLANKIAIAAKQDYFQQ